jgi:Fur family ferric uptake transcriptional regulator
MSTTKPHHDHPPTSPKDVLRRAGLRVTEMRIALLEHLSHARRPATAQQIFDELCAQAKRKRADRPDRVTVYRTLNTLVDKGLAHKLDPGDRVFRFSLTDHARCEGKKHDHEHPHFVCDSCGAVECLEGAEVVVKPPAPQSKGHAKGAAKRHVRQDGVVLHGTCESCVDEPVPRRATA